MLQEAQPNVKPVTPAALCRARQKLNPHALVWLNDRLVDLASQQLGERRWQGLRVLAVDGSTARLPSTPQIAAHFGHRKGDGVPLARWSTLYDVLNDRVIQADLAPYAEGERTFASEYVLESHPDDLFLYDRGYAAFWLFVFHCVQQRDFCARVRLDFHAEVKAFVASGQKSTLVSLTPNAQNARQCKDFYLPAKPILVRLIRVALKSGEIEVLATSLLDEKAYPTRLFTKLYALRWGIEEQYKRSKLRLEVENVSGRSPQVVLQDFQAKILAQNLTAIFVFIAQWLADERYRKRHYRYQINWANALSAMKNNLMRVLCSDAVLDLCQGLLQRMVNAVEPVRPGRSFPRHLKKVAVPAFRPNYKRTQ